MDVRHLPSRPALPKSLQTTLFEIVKKDGAAAAVARYRELRGSDTLSGRYNFGEWEINELARRLVRGEATPTAAIAILEMNGEFYPKSAAIDFMLGELHRERGETDTGAGALPRCAGKGAGQPDGEAAHRGAGEEA